MPSVEVSGKIAGAVVACAAPQMVLAISAARAIPPRNHAGWEELYRNAHNRVTKRTFLRGDLSLAL
jgi:hypothetical protein